MNWFLIAIAAPFLWSLVNHSDKYLLSKYFKGGGIGALIIYSSLFGIFVLPLVLLIDSSVLIEAKNIFVLILGGFFYSLSILLYFHALFDEEASTVAPFFQLIPVFGIFLGYFVLGEILTLGQIIASLIIVSGAMLISFDKSKHDNKFHFKKKLVLLMLVSALLLALADTIFKKIALQETFWVSTFWHYVGYVLFGSVIFSTVKGYRQEFIDTFKQNKNSILLLNVASETTTIVGNLLFNFATLLAPIAIVLTINAYQPIFVLLVGIMLTIFFPNIANEKVSRSYLLQKISAVTIVVIGSYILYS